MDGAPADSEPVSRALERLEAYERAARAALAAVEGEAAAPAAALIRTPLAALFPAAPAGEK